MRRPNRSQVYQWKIMETPCLHEGMTADLSLTSSYTPSQLQFLELQDQIITFLHTLLATCLTPYQADIIKLLLQGHNQSEVGNIHGVCQSSITKAINGNTTYQNGKAPRRHGGIPKKFRLVLMQNQEYQNYIMQLSQLDPTGNTNLCWLTQQLLTTPVYNIWIQSPLDPVHHLPQSVIPSLIEVMDHYYQHDYYSIWKKTHGYVMTRALLQRLQSIYPMPSSQFLTLQQANRHRWHGVHQNPVRGPGRPKKGTPTMTPPPRKPRKLEITPRKPYKRRPTASPKRLQFTGVYLPWESYQGLLELSQARQLSISELIRQAITVLLKNT